MSDHACTQCFRSFTVHPEECQRGCRHFPPLCCPGCDCGSFERAHEETEEERRNRTAALQKAECPGEGACHGPVKWCDNCGDVDRVCDMDECDAHHPRCSGCGGRMAATAAGWECPECDEPEEAFI